MQSQHCNSGDVSISNHGTKRGHNYHCLQLCTVVGKHLILSNMGVVGYCINHMSEWAMEFLVAINSHYSLLCCLYNQSTVRNCLQRVFTTTLHMSCIVAHKLRHITSEQTKCCIRNYIIYHLSTTAVIFFIVVGYDKAKDNYSSIMLPNGCCVYAAKVFCRFP